VVLRGDNDYCSDIFGVLGVLKFIFVNGPIFTVLNPIFI
jgi:hypothetical protein